MLFIKKEKEKKDDPFFVYSIFSIFLASYLYGWGETSCPGCQPIVNVLSLELGHICVSAMKILVAF